ncbi:peptidylprolyl isomerase [Polynucleobacter asymbioticus]|uniref:Chaperone SurA n=2 Tax=Polynucleobacter asymbioticus TaxID=576611 RepID=A0AAC9IUR7_9BURK|nr:peptidylprolyl isomerase [Polynucleobacter asymbioticus]APC00108.1 peptidylprolyl isomerase [Polynucleobacter asymbioticus]APC02416.1 peptidylprolyl isomerase [Polynucleobacter asymbioticus]
MLRSNCSIKLMNFILFLTAFLFAGIVSAQDGSKSTVTTDSKVRNIDGVAAVVNTGYITRKDIDDRIAVLKKQGTKLPEGEALRKVILERLILEKIQLQNAEQEGFYVSSKELDKITADVAAKNKLTFAELKAKIEASSTSFEKYKQQLREEVIVSRYREREVDAKIKISDAEIDNFISERNRAMLSGVTRPAPSANGGPEEIDVAQIFIPVDSGAGAGAQADAKKKADLLLREAKGDVDFLQLGAMAAKDNPQIKFQELGYRPPDRLPQLFYEAVRNTGSGQVAGAVVKSPAGYHVLKVLDRRSMAAGSPPPAQAASQEPASTTPQNIAITQTNARHILLRNRPGLSDQDAERRLQGYRDQVRAKTADFGDLAKKYSEDGSASNGGNLGWMGPGDLVPEFELAMNKLQIGEVSNPVKTEFGWHLIQVIERREAQLTVEKQREFARAAIRSRKFEQAYQDWMRELRDTATVKILNVEDAATGDSR